jgi:glycerophosphoryl diester phosphodiesterase
MRLIAHRGYSAVAPENTFAAFTRALQCGATVLECDLQCTRDGRWVVLHDATLNRTTDGRGAVSTKTLAELRTLSAGYAEKFGAQFQDERIPAFDELLRLVHGRAHVCAEIKSEAVTREGQERHALIHLVNELEIQTQVTFISFDWRAIEEMRSMDSSILLGLLFDSYQPKKMFDLAEKINAAFLIGQVDLVERHPKIIHEASERGMRIGVYTVDALPRLKRLQQLGVDAAATNRIGDWIQHFELSKGRPEQHSRENPSRQ